MAGAYIKPPYNIILAGDHDAGKTTIFQTLKACFEEGNSGKFQLIQDKKELRFESCLHKYLDASGSRKIKLRLWDTGGMERQGGAMTMTRTYFRQVIAVILVYDTLNMQSLNKLRQWVKMAQETCEYKDHLIYALWGNDKPLFQSSVNNPVDEEAVACLLRTPQFRMIEPGLVCRLNGEADRDTVEQEYEKLVRQVDSRMRDIEKKMKEASFRSQRAATDTEGEVEDRDEERHQLQGDGDKESEGRGCGC